MLMLGARDYSIGLAILWFGVRGEGRNMGRVVLSGMVLCLADLWLVVRRRGWKDAVGWGLGLGVAGWAAVGWGLLVGVE